MCFPHFCTAFMPGIVRALRIASLWMPCGHKLEIENFNFQSCSFWCLSWFILTGNFLFVNRKFCFVTELVTVQPRTLHLLQNHFVVQCGGCAFPNSIPSPLSVTTYWIQFPLAFHNLHIWKCCLIRTFCGAAGIYPICDFFRPFPHMENPHLTKGYAILTAFNAIVAVSARKTIPHTFNVRRNICCCPVRISMIRNNASQPLYFPIFIFYGRLKPVIAI